MTLNERLAQELKAAMVARDADRVGALRLLKAALGYVAIEYGSLQLDGIVLRRTAAGRLTLSYPARTDRAGRRHSYVRPVDDDARVAIEHAVLRQLAGRAGGEEPDHG